MDKSNIRATIRRPCSPEKRFCAGEPIQRKDDTAELVRAHNQEYLEKTAPLLGLDGAKGLPRVAKGSGTLDGWPIG